MAGDSNTPTVRAVRTRAVDVPMARPLATGGGTVASAALALIDLETDAGITGRAYVFCYGARFVRAAATLIEELGRVIVEAPLVPLDLAARLERALRLPGAQGFAYMAASGIDMAAWDAFAKSLDLPLVRALGAAPRPIPAYNSNGLGLIGPGRAGREAIELAEGGFRAIKLRLGYPEVETDLDAVEAVRKAVGDEVAIFTDYNQCLSRAEAADRIAWLDDTEIGWIEEPVRFDDYAGCAELRASAATPIQIGENCWGVADMEKALAAGACDYFMPDAGKIGGVTGWLRAVGLAAPIELPLSSHLYPEASAHLLAATPTAHWLEYVDWANPILAEPLAIVDGTATAPERPGNGIEWNEAAVARYTI